jgi:hypothetical protein
MDGWRWAFCGWYDTHTFAWYRGPVGAFVLCLIKGIVFGQEGGRHAGMVAGRGFCFFMSKKRPEQTGPQPNRTNALAQFSAPKQTGPKQQLLDLQIERQEEVGGLEMGILLLSEPHMSSQKTTPGAPDLFLIKSNL